MQIDVYVARKQPRIDAHLAKTTARIEASLADRLAMTVAHPTQYGSALTRVTPWPDDPSAEPDQQERTKR